ncbi:hypothetical protein [Sphingomonas quercus]|uniref:Uncharacterized protein n=1 Tax=Sphingomonas quercus TaxID=2842451 RepID=A0ABS6BK97_9SPHN|nr:hypothetical protein [Sphingomonas quercus]MBU3078589.1 hypothetical protein [Sphingomonas quercus]
MAFIAFDQVPNDAPVAARDAIAPAPTRVPGVAAVARRVRLPLPLPLLAAGVALLWIGRAVSLAVDSALLGLVAASLAFLIGVAVRSAVRPAHAGR